MRDLFMIAFLALISQISYSQDITQASKIKEVTVYEQGATIHREIDLEAFSGVSYIVFDSLPHDLSKPTIQVNVDDHLEIISVTNKQLTYKKQDAELLKPLYSQNEKLRDSIHYINKLSQALEDEKKLILKHDDFSSEDGDNVTKVKDAAALYETRLKEIYLLELKHQRWIRALNKNIAANNLEINELSKAGTYYTQVKAKVRNTQNRKGKISISYYINKASWYSFYDARIASGNSSLQHKAYITQTTGEDWTDVKISLSNKSPIRKNTAPRLTPKWRNVKEVKRKKNGDYTEGIILDVQGHSLIGANVILVGTNSGTITDIDGYFKIYNPNQQSLEFSYVGYSSLKTSVSNSQYLKVVMDEATGLNEVVITGYGKSNFDTNNTTSGSTISSEDIRNLPTKNINAVATTTAGVSGGGVYYVDGIQVKKESLATDNYARQAVSSRAQRSFNQVTIALEDPYSIPSDGQPYDVMVANHNIDYVRKYFAAPAMEQLAYCKVGVEEWQSYDLFSGKANIFVDGFFGGVTQLNMAEDKDTLWLDIGPDETVVIAREELKDYNKKTFLKRKIVEQKRFKVTITNNKDIPVEVTVAEALPVSQDEDLEVQINELSSGKMNEDTGIVEWDMRLAPRQTIEIIVDYQLKYKKDYVLN